MEQETLRESIAKCIKEYVKENNISYKEFAKQAGITNTKLSSYIHLNQTPSFQTLFKLMEVMNVDIYTITGYHPEYEEYQAIMNIHEEIEKQKKIILKQSK